MSFTQLDLKVFLEGAYKTSTETMQTTLNQRGLLPGQSPIGAFGVATAIGQPNFSDSQLWKIQSGIFDQYIYGDFNMDADTNFSDSFLWKLNSGKYSGVAHW